MVQGSLWSWLGGDTRVLYYKPPQKWLLEGCPPICVLSKGLISISAGVEPGAV